LADIIWLPAESGDSGGNGCSESDGSEGAFESGDKRNPFVGFHRNADEAS
jgi:hypothetical protein